MIFHFRPCVVVVMTAIALVVFTIIVLRAYPRLLLMLPVRILVPAVPV